MLRQVLGEAIAEAEEMEVAANNKEENRILTEASTPQLRKKGTKLSLRKKGKKKEGETSTGKRVASFAKVVETQAKKKQNSKADYVDDGAKTLN